MFFASNISVEDIIHNSMEMEKFYLGLLFGYGYNPKIEHKNGRTLCKF